MPVNLSAADLWRRLAPIMLSQGVGLLCGVAGVKLISEWVAPQDYGRYGVFVSLAPVGATVVYAGLVKFISRHWQASPARPQLIREILASTARKAPWLALICAAAAAIAAPGERLLFGGLLFVSALLLSLLQFAQSALQASREHWRDFAVSCSVSVTRSLAPPLLYAAAGIGFAALPLGFAAQALAGAAMGALMLRAWWRAPQPPAGGAVLTAVYDGPLFVVLAAAGWVLLGLHRWLVVWRFGAETGGYFTLAASIGSILPAVLGAVLLQFLQPVWFAAPSDSADARRALFARIDRVALGYTVAALALAGLLHRLVPHLVGLLIGPQYLASAPFVFATGCAAAALMLGSYYHAGLIAAHRERECTATDLSGAACLILGAVLSAAAGLEWFKRWLIASPAIPWLVNRTLARRALLRSP